MDVLLFGSFLFLSFINNSIPEPKLLDCKSSVVSIISILSEDVDNLIGFDKFILSSISIISGSISIISITINLI